MESAGIVRPGRNAWRTARADRFALLVDSDAYYDALAEALEQAERSIFIISWDIDSRLPLGRGPARRPLGQFLDALVRRRRGLHVRILSWDYSPVYVFEREAFPTLQLGARTHRRVHFEADAEHPAFAAHHQKIVVIDDALAFTGGIDLCDHRWDTPAHDAADPRRRTFSGEAYPPFHDVQAMVDGDAAAALGALARERWRRVLGEQVAPIVGAAAPWPAAIAPDLEAVSVGIARTEGAYLDRPEVREIEALYLDGIAAARRHVYIENQYLTSGLICDALAARLCEPDGPAVAILGPPCGDGWVETRTVGTAHGRMLARLREADRHGRLRLLCAVVPEGGGERTVFIHSKVFIVDDRLLRVGSANLTNRSLGVDSECDLAVEATDERVRAAIARVHARLLAEHLGLTVDEAARQLATGLLATLDAARGSPRGVREAEQQPTPHPPPPVMVFADPERPVQPRHVFDAMLPRDQQHRLRRRYLHLAGLIAVVTGLTLVWRLTPLRHAIALDVVLGWADRFGASPAAPLLALATFVLAAVLLVPMNLIFLASVVTLGPVLGAIVALLGSGGAALAGYGLGALLGADLLRRVGGRRLLALRRRLAGSGFLSVLIVRLLPIAPAQIVSMAAGAFQVRLRAFLLGTVFGAVPGVLVMALLGDRLLEAIRRPGPAPLALLVFAALAALFALLWLRSFLRRRGGS